MMGLNWQGGLLGGIDAGLSIMKRDQEKQEKIDAEERAANRQLAYAERLAAVQEAAQTRADERREQIRLSGRKSDFEFDTNPENLKVKTDAEIAKGKALATAKSDQEIEDTKRKASDTSYLESRKKIADIEGDTPQLRAQIAHWKALEARAGGDPATKALSALKLKEAQMQMQWNEDLSKTAVGSPERAALIQRGRDFQWIKEAPNDTTVATKVTNADGSETTTTTKGVGQKTNDDPIAKAIAETIAKKNAAQKQPATEQVRATSTQTAPEATFAQRLTAAVNEDNRAGNRNNFNRLADEAAQELPRLQSKIDVLRNAMNVSKSEGEKANFQKLIAKYERDIPILENILQGQKAQRGY